MKIINLSYVPLDNFGDKGIGERHGIEQHDKARFRPAAAS